MHRRRKQRCATPDSSRASAWSRASCGWATGSASRISTSRDAAEAALKSLSDAGITDVYLMPGSDPANVLSLGVFSDYQRAQRRADEVRVLGLEPRIDDRKRAGSVYWIDVDLPEPGQTDRHQHFPDRAGQDHAPGIARLPDAGRERWVCRTRALRMRCSRVESAPPQESAAARPLTRR